MANIQEVSEKIVEGVTQGYGKIEHSRKKHLAPEEDKMERQRIAPEILRLTDELLQ